MSFEVERETILGFMWGSCYSIFCCICMFCRSLFVILFFIIRPWCCLFFFYLRFLIAPLVSSNFSQVVIFSWMFLKGSMWFIFSVCAVCVSGLFVADCILVFPKRLFEWIQLSNRGWTKQNEIHTSIASLYSWVVHEYYA